MKQTEWWKRELGEQINVKNVGCKEYFHNKIGKKSKEEKRMLLERIRSKNNKTK